MNNERKVKVREQKTSAKRGGIEAVAFRGV